MAAEVIPLHWVRAVDYFAACGYWIAVVDGEGNELCRFAAKHYLSPMWHGGRCVLSGTAPRTVTGRLMALPFSVSPLTDLLAYTDELVHVNLGDMVSIEVDF